MFFLLYVISKCFSYCKWSKNKIFHFWRGIRNALKQKVFSLSSSFNEVLKTSDYVPTKIFGLFNVIWHVDMTSNLQRH